MEGFCGVDYLWVVGLGEQVVEGWTVKDGSGWVGRGWTVGEIGGWVSGRLQGEEAGFLEQPVG